MNFLNKNSIVIGLVLGILLPILGYGLLKGLFWVLSQAVNSDYSGWRERTITLLAICFNLIPFNYYKKKKYFTNSMRGVVVPTVIFGGLWVYYFRDFILGQ